MHQSIFIPVPPASGRSGALAGDSQHYVVLLVNQVISKANEAYSPLCPGARGAGIYIDWCIIRSTFTANGYTSSGTLFAIKTKSLIVKYFSYTVYSVHRENAA